MSLRELLFGRPLRSEEQEAQKVGPMRGVPLLGLDALASAGYGPEAALTVLLPLGVASTWYIGPIMLVVVLVLLLVYLSYRQLIAAYPDGGGSYTVASENLGERFGLLAASALSLDYVLNVAVAISAGVGAIVSAEPRLLPHTLLLCLAVLALLTIVNLRGVREAGLVFMLPTYVFVACLGATIVLGVVKTLHGGGHPVPVAHPPVPAHATATLGIWVLMRAFASGCTAMTGVEAVSNGVQLFEQPRTRLAQRTLTIIIGILVFLLLGIAYLSWSYGIAATPPGEAGYESVLSQIIAAVAGRGVFYYLSIASVFAVLCLSANTSFAGLPRLWHVLALDEYLPADFAHLGRRLVYSRGIVVLTVMAGTLLIVFRGITDRLIPLFAIGAFLAFTLSQWGMVRHWHRNGGASARRAVLVNAIGAVATGTTLVVVTVSKFVEGAWITILIVPAFLALYIAIRRTFDRIDLETDVGGPLQLDEPPPPIVVVPLKSLDRVARKSLRFAITISPDVHVVNVLTQEPDLENLRTRWREYVERPVEQAGFAPPKLVVLSSSFREFFGPVLRYVRQLAAQHPRRYVAVVVPELVQRRWYHLFLHSHRATLLKAMLLWRGGPRVIVINTPWYLRDPDDDGTTG